MDFKTVAKFEEKIASFFGAPFAVATDSCTHAIELAMRYAPAPTYTCPSHTYISVPFTFKKLNAKWQFNTIDWSNYYYICDNIIDAAVLWKPKSYISGTYMCLSFQFKKHLGLGRGGMILCQKHRDWLDLKKLSYDGRMPDNTGWANQNIDSIGYHYYMTPETAQLGIEKLDSAIKAPPKSWNHADYPDLRSMKVFQ